MAKNWKRAHDKLAEHLDRISRLAIDTERELQQERSRRLTLESDLFLACGHLAAAADQFDARRVTSTADLLRREANRLYPYKAMAMTNTKSVSEERR